MENSFVLFNGGLKVDFFKIEKNKKSKEEILKNAKNLTIDTILMNNFEDRIESSYVSPQVITDENKFYIYRKTPFQTYYNYLGELQGNSFTFSDYNIVNNEFYHYLATIEKKQEDGTLQYTSYENLDESDNPEYAQAKWDKFSLCDVIFDSDKEVYYVTGNIWLLNCNIQSNEITQNTSVTTWETLGKYNKISIGQENFDSGTLNCLLGEIKEYIVQTDKGDTIKKFGYTERININNKYSTEKEKEISWKNFISNNNLKLLKDNKGNKWIIQILQDSTRTIDYNVIGKLTTINIQWEEVEDSNKYPILEFYE